MSGCLSQIHPSLQMQRSTLASPRQVPRRPGWGPYQSRAGNGLAKLGQVSGCAIFRNQQVVGSSPTAGSRNPTKPVSAQGLVSPGFLLIALGIGLYSIPAALVTVGAVLLIAGGCDVRDADERKPKSSTEEIACAEQDRHARRLTES